MDDLDIQGIVGEVARRHNILVGPRDPLFAIISLNELVLSRYIALAKYEMAAAREQAQADRAEHVAAAKKVGESIVTAAADYVAKQHRASMAEYAEALAKAAAAHHDKIAAEAKAARRIIIWSAIIAGFAACVVLGAIVASWGMWLTEK